MLLIGVEGQWFVRVRRDRRFEWRWLHGTFGRIRGRRRTAEVVTEQLVHKSVLWCRNQTEARHIYLQTSAVEDGAFEAHPILDKAVCREEIRCGYRDALTIVFVDSLHRDYVHSRWKVPRFA